MRLRNTNERFGDTAAIYEAASCEALANELAPMLATWAGEATEQTGETIKQAVQRLRGELIDGLEEVSNAS